MLQIKAVDELCIRFVQFNLEVNDVDAMENFLETFPAIKLTKFYDSP